MAIKTNGRTAATTQKPSKVGAAATWADDRLGLAGLAKKNIRKVFPDHWSFMLGEIALWSFVILLLTGVFLTLWFKPSMAEVIYDGSYEQYRGLHMSEAYASTLGISFDVRGGRSTTGRQSCSSPRCSCTSCASSSPAPSASPVSSTG